jgi:polygalacturonase
MKSAAQCTLAPPLLALLPSLAEAQDAEPTRGANRGARKEPAPSPALTLNVKDYGAIGDGKTKDTLAIQQTIERCAVLGGGEVVLPAGDYLSGALTLRSGVTLRVAEGATLNGSPDRSDYPLTQVRWEGHWIKGYSAFISAVDAENIGISGPGKIVGSPTIVGRLERPSGLRLPALLEFVNCKNIRVINCSTQNYGMWSIHPAYCDNVAFVNLKVKSGADGIDIDSCRHVTIDGCDFDTTDDCISLKSGRGIEGYTIARVTEDVHISNCTFFDKVWACIGIGSETSGGIRNVYVDHCKCLGAGTFAIYIKSRPGRGAFIENIYMSDLDVSGAKKGFLRFNILNSGIADTPNLVPGDDGIPTIRNFEFRNIKVNDLPELVLGNEIHPLKPLDGLVLKNLTGSSKKGITLANIRNAHLSGIKVTGFEGPLLSISHVTGTGLAGATPIAAEDLPKVPDPILPPTVPYKLQ